MGALTYFAAFVVLSTPTSAGWFGRTLEAILANSSRPIQCAKAPNPLYLVTQKTTTNCFDEACIWNNTLTKVLGADGKWYIHSNRTLPEGSSVPFAPSGVLKLAITDVPCLIGTERATTDCLNGNCTRNITITASLGDDYNWHFQASKPFDPDPGGTPASEAAPANNIPVQTSTVESGNDTKAAVKDDGESTHELAKAGFFPDNSTLGALSHNRSTVFPGTDQSTNRKVTANSSKVPFHDNHTSYHLENSTATRNSTNLRNMTEVFKNADAECMLPFYPTTRLFIMCLLVCIFGLAYERSFLAAFQEERHRAVMITGAVTIAVQFALTLVFEITADGVTVLLWLVILYFTVRVPVFRQLCREIVRDICTGWIPYQVVIFLWDGIELPLRMMWIAPRYLWTAAAKHLRHTSRWLHSHAEPIFYMLLITFVITTVYLFTPCNWLVDEQLDKWGFFNARNRAVIWVYQALTEACYTLFGAAYFAINDFCGAFHNLQNAAANACIGIWHFPGKAMHVCSKIDLNEWYQQAYHLVYDQFQVCFWESISSSTGYLRAKFSICRASENLSFPASRVRAIFTSFLRQSAVSTFVNKMIAAVMHRLYAIPQFIGLLLPRVMKVYLGDFTVSLTRCFHFVWNSPNLRTVLHTRLIQLLTTCLGLKVATYGALPAFFFIVHNRTYRRTHGARYYLVTFLYVLIEVFILRRKGYRPFFEDVVVALIMTRIMLRLDMKLPADSRHVFPAILKLARVPQNHLEKGLTWLYSFAIVHRIASRMIVPVCNYTYDRLLKQELHGIQTFIIQVFYPGSVPLIALKALFAPPPSLFSSRLWSRPFTLRRPCRSGDDVHSDSNVRPSTQDNSRESVQPLRSRAFKRCKQAREHEQKQRLEINSGASTSIYTTKDDGDVSKSEGSITEGEDSVTENEDNITGYADTNSFTKDEEDITEGRANITKEEQEPDQKQPDQVNSEVGNKQEQPQLVIPGPRPPTPYTDSLLRNPNSAESTPPQAPRIREAPLTKLAYATVNNPDSSSDESDWNSYA